MSIDTEGSEYEILKSFDFDKWNVQLFAIELGPAEKDQAIDRLMEENGYARKVREIFRWRCLVYKTLASPGDESSNSQIRQVLPDVRISWSVEVRRNNGMPRFSLLHLGCLRIAQWSWNCIQDSRLDRAAGVPSAHHSLWDAARNYCACPNDGSITDLDSRTDKNPGRNPAFRTDFDIGVNQRHIRPRVVVRTGAEKAVLGDHRVGFDPDLGMIVKFYIASNGNTIVEDQVPRYQYLDPGHDEAVRADLRSSGAQNRDPKEVERARQKARNIHWQPLPHRAANRNRQRPSRARRPQINFSCDYVGIGASHI